MKVSVVIPTYNSAKFIGATLDSVLRQTLPPDEILVLDDGSTDDTISVLNSYDPRVTVSQQTNRGVAAARNELCRRATGDLVAFLDHDDLWHPCYLETQSKLSTDHPDAAAFFTGHVDFRGYENYHWVEDPLAERPANELIGALDFLKRYNRCAGNFASMSYCCISRTMITKMGGTPFAVAVSGADDFCLCNRFPLFGSVAYAPCPLVAYRIIEESQSADRLKGVGLSVRSFEILYRQYEEQGNRQLTHAFMAAFASKRRLYGRLLMGAGRTPEARRQFLEAARISDGFASRLKSLALWLLTVPPPPLQPAWPSGDRESGDNMVDSHHSEDLCISESAQAAIEKKVASKSSLR